MLILENLNKLAPIILGSTVVIYVLIRRAYDYYTIVNRA